MLATRWSTASIGHTADASATELSALGAHLQLCTVPNGRILAMQCLAQSMHGFAVSRFVTTLVVLALLVGVTSVLL
jgi:hypothetical protein